MTQAACLKSMVMSKKFILVRRKMKTKPNYSLLILEIKRGLNMEEKKKKTTKKKTNHLFSQRGSSVTPWTYNPIVSQL